MIFRTNVYPLCGLLGSEIVHIMPNLSLIKHCYAFPWSKGEGTMQSRAANVQDRPTFTEAWNPVAIWPSRHDGAQIDRPYRNRPLAKPEPDICLRSGIC